MLEKMEKPKYGIDASFLGEDDVGRYVAIPVRSSKEYLTSLSYLDNNDVIEKKYNVKLTSQYDHDKELSDENTIVFKLYYKENQAI